MLTKGRTVKVRLNYSIQVSLFDRLGAYCASVGRTPTDLTRQLILEFLDGEILLPDMTPQEGPEKRTSVFMPSDVLSSFDAAAGSYGVPKSRIVSGLVLFFLDRRVDVNVFSDVSPDYKEALEKLVLEILETPVDWGVECLPPALKRALDILNLNLEESPSECRP